MKNETLKFINISGSEIETNREIFELTKVTPGLETFIAPNSFKFNKLVDFQFWKKLKLIDISYNIFQFHNLKRDATVVSVGYENAAKNSISQDIQNVEDINQYVSSYKEVITNWSAVLFRAIELGNLHVFKMILDSKLVPYNVNFYPNSDIPNSFQLCFPYENNNLLKRIEFFYLPCIYLVVLLAKHEILAYLFENYKFENLEYIPVVFDYLFCNVKKKHLFQKKEDCLKTLKVLYKYAPHVFKNQKEREGLYVVDSLWKGVKNFRYKDENFFDELLLLMVEYSEECFYLSKNVSEMILRLSTKNIQISGLSPETVNKIFLSANNGDNLFRLVRILKPFSFEVEWNKIFIHSIKLIIQSNQRYTLETERYFEKLFFLGAKIDNLSECFENVTAGNVNDEQSKFLLMILYQNNKMQFELTPKLLDHICRRFFKATLAYLFEVITWKYNLNVSVEGDPIIHRLIKAYSKDSNEREKFYETLEILLAKGIDVDVLDNEKNSFLMNISSLNEEHIERIFSSFDISKKNINYLNSQGKNALFYASQKGNSKLFAYLAKFGENMGVLNEGEKNFLSVILSNKDLYNKEILEKLNEMDLEPYINQNEKTSHRTPIFYFCETVEKEAGLERMYEKSFYQNVKIFSKFGLMLISKGADNQFYYKNQSFLYFSANCYHLDASFVKGLIERGADVNFIFQKEDNNSILLSLLSKRLPKSNLVKLITRQKLDALYSSVKLDLNVVNKFGYTALMMATRNHSYQDINAILDKCKTGFNVSIDHSEKKWKWTALHFLCYHFQKKMFASLFSRFRELGASFKEDINSKTPLQLISEKFNSPIDKGFNVYEVVEESIAFNLFCSRSLPAMEDEVQMSQRSNDNDRYMKKKFGKMPEDYMMKEKRKFNEDPLMRKYRLYDRMTFGVIRCRCGEIPEVRKSDQIEHRGKKYYRCSKCDFFEWI